jgi:hypothetical protein
VPGSGLAALVVIAAALWSPAAAQPAAPLAPEPGQEVEREHAAPAPAEPSGAETPAVPADLVAVLQGLDKVTARVSTFEAPLNRIVRFGTLEIIARACHKRPPEEPPESAAFLEIRDVKPDEPPADLFMGWMFASSPALSALEHPVYDIWILDCRSAETSASSSSG